MNETKYCIEKGCEKAFTFTVDDQKFYERKGLQPPKRCKACRQKRRDSGTTTKTQSPGGKVWSTCDSCQMETWTVDVTGMCGPCTFGDSSTIDGNW